MTTNADFSVFFTKPEIRQAISEAIVNIKSTSITDEFEQHCISYILLILGNMVSKPEDWDKHCQVNINWFGSSFVNQLAQKELSKDELQQIYSVCFRFLNELFLTVKKDLTHEYGKAREFGIDNLMKFNSVAQQQMRWAIDGMPTLILKELLNSDGIQAVRKYNEEKTEFSNRLEELKTAELKVTTLKEALEKYQTAFNFVGLYEGFNNITSEKLKEKGRIVIFLKFLGILILMPLVVELVLFIFNRDLIVQTKTIFLLSFLPAASITAILIYYFRVVLGQLKTINSQLIQLELRKTLCQFIQNYADYSSDIKKKDKEALAKFESIIFSGIVSTDEKLPSTFDGLDQLTNLIKTMKSN